jgi:hypothetical protein
MPESSGTVATQARARVEAFHTQMLNRAQLNSVGDNRRDDIMASQAERIFAAESVDDILSADLGGTIQMRDVGGTVWEIRGFEPMESNRDDIEGGHGYYLSCDATYLGGPPDIAKKAGLVLGQTYALQTGAELALFKLRALEAAEAYPIKLSVIALTTRGGNTVVKLGPAPEMAIQGSAN